MCNVIISMMRMIKISAYTITCKSTYKTCTEKRYIIHPNFSSRVESWARNCTDILIKRGGHVHGMRKS